MKEHDQHSIVSCILNKWVAVGYYTILYPKVDYSGLLYPETKWVSTPRHIRVKQSVVDGSMPSYLGRPIHGSADACCEAPLQTWAIGVMAAMAHGGHR